MTTVYVRLPRQINNCTEHASVAIFTPGGLRDSPEKAYVKDVCTFFYPSNSPEEVNDALADLAGQMLYAAVEGARPCAAPIPGPPRRCLAPVTSSADLLAVAAESQNLRSGASCGRVSV